MPSSRRCRTPQALIGSSFRIDEPVLALAPRLQVVSSISVGVDNYDIAALKRRGIVLCHTPGVLTETTADTIFALVMATSRRLVELALHVREGHWTRNIDESLFGWDVQGKTLGIAGLRPHRPGRGAARGAGIRHAGALPQPGAGRGAGDSPGARGTCRWTSCSRRATSSH